MNSILDFFLYSSRPVLFQAFYQKIGNEIAFNFFKGPQVLQTEAYTSISASLFSLKNLKHKTLEF